MKGCYILFFLFLFIGSLIGCSKNDAPDHLPPATQTGAGIFACLVNGEVFVHNNGLINCFYQYMDRGYYFGIQGKGENNIAGMSSILIATEDKEIQEGESYQLLTETSGNVYGGYTINGYSFLTTNPNYKGNITFSKLDYENHIVSGTFWFNLKHPVTADTIKIRQGRFDVHFGT